MNCTTFLRIISHCVLVSFLSTNSVVFAADGSQEIDQNELRDPIYIRNLERNSVANFTTVGGILNVGLDLSDGQSIADAINSPYERFVCTIKPSIYKQIDEHRRELYHGAKHAERLYEDFIDAIFSGEENQPFRKSDLVISMKNLWGSTIKTVTELKYHDLESRERTDTFIFSKDLRKLFKKLQQVYSFLKTHRSVYPDNRMEMYGFPNYLRFCKVDAAGNFIPDVYLKPTANGYELVSEVGRIAREAYRQQIAKLRRCKELCLVGQKIQLVSSTLFMAFAKFNLDPELGDKRYPSVPYVPPLFNFEDFYWQDSMKRNSGKPTVALVPYTLVARSFLRDKKVKYGDMIGFRPDSRLTLFTPEEWRRFDAEKLDGELYLDKVLEQKHGDVPQGGQTRREFPGTPSIWEICSFWEPVFSLILTFGSIPWILKR